MNLKLSTAAAATLLLAIAGQASAAITLGSVQGGSSLILSVWDDARSISYTRNLGGNLNGFLPSFITTLPNDGNIAGVAVTGDKTPASGLTLNFAGDVLFAQTFASSLPDNVRWNIVAFDNQSSTATGLSRVITTASSTPLTTNAGIGTIGNGGTNYLNALLANTSIASQGSVTTNDPSLQSYAGNANWGDALNGSNLSTSATGFGSTLDFYYLARTQASGLNSTLATNFQYGVGNSFAKWSLSADGTATYSLSPVPLPPALWLFGPGLLAVLGFARRRGALAATAA